MEYFPSSWKLIDIVNEIQELWLVYSTLMYTLIYHIYFLKDFLEIY